MYEPPDHVPTHAELLQEVEKRVAGDNLKNVRNTMVNLVRRHMLSALNEREYRVPNVIVIGQTGGGKSHTVRSVLECAGVPFVEVNATQFSDVGFIGPDLSSMFAKFLDPPFGERRQDKRMIPIAERWGVVVIDEFDKWRMPPIDAKGQERHTGRALQAELLKMVEGETVLTRHGDSGRPTPFRTHHLLFIAIGAFEGLYRNIAAHFDGEIAVATAHMHAETVDLVSYGFFEELIGRFSTIIPLPLLDHAAMTRIITDHIWPQYCSQAEDDGIHLDASPASLMAIGNVAMQNSIGARSIVPIIEKILRPLWVRSKPGDTISLTPDGVYHQTATLDHAEDEHDQDAA